MIELGEIQNLTRTDLEDLVISLQEQQARDAVKIDTLQQEIASMEGSTDKWSDPQPIERFKIDL